MIAQLSFGQSILLEALKAVFTAVFVAGAAALVVRAYQDRAEQRRSDFENQRNELAKARERALQLEQDKRAIKTDLVTRVSDAAGSFYFLCQQHWRQKGSPETWGEPDGVSLDRAYVEWAAKCEALEREIGARYGWGCEPELLWHQIRDLLTIRYFDLRDRNSAKLRANNAQTDEVRHSGLSETELKDMGKVLKAFRTAMQDLTKSLLREDLTA